MHTPLTSQPSPIVVDATNGAQQSPPVEARRCEPMIRVAQGEELYAEGDEANIIYKVISGFVRTCKFLSDGRRQIDAFHCPGDIFGLESTGERTLSAEAITDCVVIAFRQGEPHGASRENAPIHLLNLAMTTLSETRTHMMLLGRRSASEKMATFLLSWAERASEGAVLSLPMGRQDIADYLGLTMETVSRTLSQFERKKFIELDAARRVRLRNLPALEAMIA